MICPHCFKPLPDGDKFCSNCGNPILKPEASPTPRVVPHIRPPASPGKKTGSAIGWLVTTVILLGITATVLISVAANRTATVNDSGTSPHTSTVTSEDRAAEQAKVPVGEVWAESPSESVRYGLAAYCPNFPSYLQSSSEWTSAGHDVVFSLGYWMMSAGVGDGLGIMVKLTPDELPPNSSYVMLAPAGPDASRVFAEWGCPSSMKVMIQN